MGADMLGDKPAIRSALALAIAVAVAPALTAAPAIAADNMVTLQGDPTKQVAEHDKLFADLAAAASEDEANTVASRIWLLWFRAPNAEAATLMNEALKYRSAQDVAGAVSILDKLVAAAPDWAEAWNQRATMRYLQHDFAGSLADIDEVLKREPKHFGALSGEVLILMHQGKIESAKTIVRRLIAIDPFLPERALLDDAQDGEGRDI